MKKIILDLQTKLASEGFDPGVRTGELGAETYGAFISAVVRHDLGTIGLQKGRAYAHLFPIYDIMTPRRIAHFIAQCAEETGGYRYFTELGGQSYFAKYDGRMGNGPGEGYHYRGRGDIQITGKNNYRTYGTRLGIDLLNDPDKASTPEIAANLACLYWTDHQLNFYADNDDVEKITKLINGGLNGLVQRQAYYQRGRELWNY